MCSDNAQLIPATPQQQGIWFYSLANGVAYWNFIDIRCFKGRLRTGALSSALMAVITRHSALRTNFRLHDTVLYQVVNDVVSPGEIFRLTQYEEVDGDARETIIREETGRIQQHEFDLGNEALIKLRVLRFGATYYFVLCINHIVIDRTAIQVFWSELAEFYSSKTVKDSPVRQYVDFSREQNDFQSSAAGRTQRQYWLHRLAGQAPVLDLPFYKNRQDARVYSCEKTLSPQLATDIRSFSLQKRILYSSAFQAAYFILLYKYSQKDRIMIGNVVNGRSGKGKNDAVIGLFANTLLNIQQINGQDTLLALIGKVNDDLLRGFDHADVPYDDWIKHCPARNKDATLPLFQAAFNMIKAAGADIRFGDLEELPVPESRDYVVLESQYDVNMLVIHNPEQVTIRLEVRCSEKWRGMPDLLLTTYLHILDHLVYRCNDAIVDLDMLSADERAMLASFNSTAREMPQPPIIHELFRSQAAKRGENTALICDKEEMSYAELDRQSDKLAGWLRQQGVGRGTVVGILLSRSVTMVNCMLAVMKAGAAYLPLDPDYPVQRLTYLVQDTQAALILTEKELRVKLPEGVNSVFVAELSLADTGEPVANFSQADDPAYIIYTSGSTGTPKGVMIPHRSTVNLMHSMTGMIDFSGKRVYSLTTISFDMFVVESLLALCYGASVQLAKEEEQKNPAKAAEAIVAGGVDIFHGTPSRIKMLLRAGTDFLAGLSCIIFGGEPFPTAILPQLKAGRPKKVFNMYGPTETNVYCSGREVSAQNDITAGPPYPNTRIYILDEEGRVQGIGIAGEIGIAGANVSLGYWRMPEVTAQRFVQDTIVAGEKIYRSGDIGRWTPDGELEIIGRNDNQVKIRGYRVEPDDIAFHLRSHPEIKDAVVLCIREQEYDDLYAYYISDRPLEAKQLRIHCRSMLPDFMIPAYFIHMQSFPHTHNNKVDKSALKNIKSTGGIDRLADLKNINSQLLTLWLNALQVDNQLFNERAFDNFFESGGHSLKALSILDAIEKEFHVKIPVRDFFKYPTIQFLNDKLTVNI